MMTKSTTDKRQAISVVIIEESLRASMIYHSPNGRYGGDKCRDVHGVPKGITDGFAPKLQLEGQALLGICFL